MAPSVRVVSIALLLAFVASSGARAQSAQARPPERGPSRTITFRGHISYLSSTVDALKTACGEKQCAVGMPVVLRIQIAPVGPSGIIGQVYALNQGNGDSVSLQIGTRQWSRPGGEASLTITGGVLIFGKLDVNGRFVDGPASTRFDLSLYVGLAQYAFRDPAGTPAASFPARFPPLSAFLPNVAQGVPRRYQIYGGSGTPENSYQISVDLDEVEEVVPPRLVDPVTLATATKPARILLTPEELLSPDAREVKGVAADGAARVVIRVPTTNPGTAIDAALCTIEGEDSSCGGSLSPDEYGALTTLDDLQAVSQQRTSVTGVRSQQLKATGTGVSAHGFLVYRAPANFTRKGSKPTARDFTSARCPDRYEIDDCEAASRLVFVRIRYDAATTQWLQVTIVRPPVLLIHGLTSDPCSWNTFVPLARESTTFEVFRATYTATQEIDGSEPDYFFDQVRANVIGVEWNARRLATRRFNSSGLQSPLTLPAMLDGFKRGSERREGYCYTNRYYFDPPNEERPAVAALKFDVVGHSMGGLIARALVSFDLTRNDASFDTDAVNRLITIGTPHRGSHYAYELLRPDHANACVRVNAAVWDESISLQTVSIGGRDWGGAIGDLTGDGVQVSALVDQLRERADSIPISMIAGKFNQGNCEGLDQRFILARDAGRLSCGQRAEEIGPGQWRVLPADPLIARYSCAQWKDNFRGEDSDGFVSVFSALDGLRFDALGTRVFEGVVHGPGTVKDIGFYGPHLQNDQRVANYTILLLNAAGSDQDYYGRPAK